MITKEEINHEVDAFAGTYNSAPIITLLNKLEAERDEALEKLRVMTAISRSQLDICIAYREVAVGFLHEITIDGHRLHETQKDLDFEVDTKAQRILEKK